MNQFSRALVTGGAGFIGSWLSESLVNLGASVRILDNFRSGTVNNLASVLRSVELVKGDVRDYEVVERAVEDAEFVFHLAANASVPASTDNPDYDFNTNALGTYNVLKAMRKKCEDAVLVYTSSAAVYGEPAYTPIDERHPLSPASFYGASKVAGEAYCSAFHRIYGMKTVILRLFNTYGPRQPRYVMYDLLKKLSRNPKKLEMLGTGHQKRDFTYVTDCVTAILLAAERPDAIGEALNVGNGRSVTIKRLVELILDRLGLTDETTVFYTGKSWKGDVSALEANIDLSKKILGYDPKVSLERGVARVIDWFYHAQRKTKL